MAIVEALKRAVARLSTLGCPGRRTVAPSPRRPELVLLRPEPGTPNNPRLPLVVYRAAIGFAKGCDPAAVLESRFARHGWRGARRDGLYDHQHFHSATHEVLGIARGRATVRFGGDAGPRLTLRAGDVAVIPAGTGLRRLRASRDLEVVGAYPAGGRYDDARPDEVEAAEARRSIARVPRPRQDPVYGASGPLPALWAAALSPRQRQVAIARGARPMRRAGGARS